MRLAGIMLAAPLALGAAASAQDYPVRNVTVIVPYPPGGTSDNMMRILQEKVQRQLGQTVVIDNRPGATGNIGGAAVANAAPDGYTLLNQATMIGYFPALFPRLTYDPLKSYAAIIPVGESPSVFVVRRGSPLRTLADLDAAQKARPGGLNVGNTGIGSPAHLAAVLLAKLNNFTYTHVPYRGTSPMLADLLGGQIDVGVSSAGGFKGLIESGEIRVLAVASPRRSAVIPNEPTTKEAGYAEMNGGVRYFMAAPAGTPKPILDKIYAAFKTTLTDPAIVKQLTEAGFDVVAGSPEETRAMIEEQRDLWTPLIKDLGLKIE